MRAFAGGHNGDRCLQVEGDNCLGTEFYLLAFAGCLNSAAHAGSGRRSNASAFSASSESAYEGADQSAPAYLLSCVLSARAAFAAELVSLNVVILVPHFYAIELQLKQRFSREFAGTLKVGDVAFNVITSRNDGFAIH